MPRIQKHKLLGILIFACILMVIMGISMPALHMQPGIIFMPKVYDQETLGSSFGDEEISWFWTIVQGFQVLLLVLLPLYILTNLFTKEGRKRLLSDIVKIMMLFLILMWFSERWTRLTQPEDLGNQQSEPLNLSEIRGEVPFPGFDANSKPWMVILLIIVLAGLAAWITYLLLKKLANRRINDESQLQELADKAQTALDGIEANILNFDDVIIRCYAEMSQTLRAESGIQRARAMTTQEFGQELLTKGFPAWPVQQLTILFEQVRYGHQQPGERDKRIAIESLREIVSFCRGQT